ncbi:MAG: NnrU family protein [Aestuariivita sp.]|nr:NnrU family protein [Aestuariivita sp.]
MSWFIMGTGIALWWFAHLFKRILPNIRKYLGNFGAPIVGTLLVVSLILMIIGYRQTEFLYVWQPPEFMVHINNLLMVIAIFLFTPAAKKGRLVFGMRHPQLIGFKTWAFAHLIVNGDLASLLLFGFLLAWAVIEVIVINRLDREWHPLEGQGTYIMDGLFLVGSLVLLGIIGYIHYLIGVWPFPA